MLERTLVPDIVRSPISVTFRFPILLTFAKWGILLAQLVAFPWLGGVAWSQTTESRMAPPHLVQRGPIVQLDFFQPWVDSGLPRPWTNTFIMNIATGEVHINGVPEDDVAFSRTRRAWLSAQSKSPDVYIRRMGNQLNNALVRASGKDRVAYMRDWLRGQGMTAPAIDIYNAGLWGHAVSYSIGQLLPSLTAGPIGETLVPGWGSAFGFNFKPGIDYSLLQKLNVYWEPEIGLFDHLHSTNDLKLDRCAAASGSTSSHANPIQSLTYAAASAFAGTLNIAVQQIGYASSQPNTLTPFDELAVLGIRDGQKSWRQIATLPANKKTMLSHAMKNWNKFGNTTIPAYSIDLSTIQNTRYHFCVIARALSSSAGNAGWCGTEVG